ncbi:GNAT family N-acetyltransferase [Rhodospirillum centenum]|uniref:Acetyltransferase, GNAT family n=1 Tax=Rhodospirillum centenum (strain ATCC 51521 / SW) TaxID=414684 RepID=B6IUM2_RHOCS|nr:GNAT family N-acetyltransferase [Rhodospirillum centenum]ACI99847.1 acetyltransferase, GNAT family [Rhodospirillum centenum SW]
MDVTALPRRPVADCTAAEVAAALNAGFEGYLVPVRIDAPGYERRFRGEDLDPFSSYLFGPPGRPAGVMLVARRGWTARIASLGVAPDWRGRGLGRHALDLAAAEARMRGDHALLLEVFEQNTRALALYERLGFRRLRRLYGHRREPVRPEAVAGAAALRPADPLSLSRALLRAGEGADLPWMLQPETLAKAAHPFRALALAGEPEGQAPLALLRDPGTEAMLLTALFVPPDRRGLGLGRRLLAALAAAYPGRPWLIPQIVPEGPLDAFLLATGWTRQALNQFDMRLDL